MNKLRLITPFTLLAATIFQLYMGAHYHRKAATLRQQASELDGWTVKLNRQIDRYKAMPTPYAEAGIELLKEKGFTNLSCLVWGEHSGEMSAFLVKSNVLDYLGHIDVKMIERSADEVSDRRKL